MKNHLLLINPAVNLESQSALVNSMINKSLPTSLGVLAAYILNTDLTAVNIIDEQIHFLDDHELERTIQAMDAPRIVGMSVLTINSARAHELARRVKAIDPDCRVICGGIHPTVCPDEMLADQCIDVVVRGEGEKALRELTQRILNGQDYADVLGVSVRRGGANVHNEPQELIIDLDEIPPFPYHLFRADLDKYSSFAAVFGSRGCPYNCIFCSSRSVSGKRYRYHSVERVVGQIRLLVEEFGQQEIWLMDDNIAVNRRRFLGLLDAIMQEGLHKKTCFHGSMRGDNVSEELLRKAKECNFKMIAFGLETGSERLMQVLQKGETVQQVADAIRLTDQIGLATAATIIFGLPTETREDRRTAVKLVQMLPLASVRFNTLTPYPGTAVWEMLKDTGKITVRKNWANFAVQYMWEGDDIPYVPDGTNRYELMFDTMYANLSFYLSISGLKRMLKSSFAGGNVVKLNRRWYLQPKSLLRMCHLGFYLTKRFLVVGVKMLWSRIFRSGSGAPRPSLEAN